VEPSDPDGSDGARAPVVSFSPGAVDVVVDPLLTVLTSLVELFGPLRHRRSPRVIEQANLLAGALPIGELVATLRIGAHAYCPQVLLPAGGVVSFREQVEGMRSLPAEHIAADMRAEAAFADSVSDARVTNPASRDEVWRRWIDRPAPSMSRYCDLLTRYEDAVVRRLEPHYERRLRSEAKRLVEAADAFGPALAFGKVHARIHATDTRLDVTGVSPPGGRPTPLRLRFSPLIASSRTRMNDIAYAAWSSRRSVLLGAASGGLAVDGPASDGGPLVHLLGQPRALIVASLHRLPGSTTELAGELGYAPSTISHHLSFLLAAGVVETRRAGPAVLYALTDRGVALATLP
jgi:DNA-binding transcriptional ArsR family regulator